MHHLVAAKDSGGDPEVIAAAAAQAPLHSWKEIADYLRHGVRTVQRWEQTEGLPVHRHPHEKRDAVYAFPAELDAWWISYGNRLQNVEAVPGTVVHRIRGPGKGWLWAASALTLVLIVAAGIWIKLGSPRFGSPILSFEKRDWVLVADFDNQTGEPIFDRSLLTAFIVSLEQSPHANVLPRARISAALQRMGKNREARIDEQLGREMCIREHIKGLITCGIGKVGREYALTAQLIDPQTGAAMRSYFERVTSQDQTIGALGRMTGNIRRDLGESLASIQQNNDPLPLVTTTSLEALRLFVEGNYLWRKGDYNEALKAWQTALQHDPDFAMVHAALGDAYMSHIFSNATKGKEHYQRALLHAERVTDRERLYIQASFEHGLGHVSQAVQDYRLYLKTYPDDAKARFDLGILLMHHGRYEEAIPELKEVLHLDPSNARAWIDVATSWWGLDRPAEALAAYAKAFEMEPTWISLGNLNHEYGFALVRSGNLMKAREVFSLALAKNDSTRWHALRSLALLDMYEGKYRDAKARLRQSIALSRADKEHLGEARNHLYMAILLQGEGDRIGQVRELDRASEALAAWSSPVPWLSALIGAGYARAGALDSAQRILKTLSSNVDRDNPAEISGLYLLEGEVTLARHNYPLAIEKFQVAAQGTDKPLGLASLCVVYQQSRATGQAVECYEKLAGLGLAALGWEPQQSWLEAHADLAEAYFARGQATEASRWLNELAALWKNADPELPLARRMAGLQERIRSGK